MSRDPSTALLHAMPAPSPGAPAGSTLTMSSYVVSAGTADAVLLADARAALSVLRWAEAIDLCFVDDGAGARADAGVPPVSDEAVSERQRSDNRRTAFLERQPQLVRSLLDRGLRRGELLELTLADLPTTADVAVYLRRRAEMLLPADAGASVLVTEDGRPVAAEDVDDHLARRRVPTTRD